MDAGLTHIALRVRNVDDSMAFYADYAAMRPIHARTNPDGHRVVWLSDLTRDFAVVLAENPTPEPSLGPFAHLGVAVSSRGELDHLAHLASNHGCLRSSPVDSGPPLGYWCLLTDPDGHTLELSVGQEVGATVDARRLAEEGT